MTLNMNDQGKLESIDTHDVHDCKCSKEFRDKLSEGDSRGAYELKNAYSKKQSSLHDIKKLKNKYDNCKRITNLAGYKEELSRHNYNVAESILEDAESLIDEANDEDKKEAEKALNAAKKNYLNCEIEAIKNQNDCYKLQSLFTLAEGAYKEKLKKCFIDGDLKTTWRVLGSYTTDMFCIEDRQTFYHDDTFTIMGRPLLKGYTEPIHLEMKNKKHPLVVTIKVWFLERLLQSCVILKDE